MLPVKKNIKNRLIFSAASLMITPEQKKVVSGIRKFIPGRFGSMVCIWGNLFMPNMQNRQNRIRFLMILPASSLILKDIPVIQKQVCFTMGGMKAKNNSGPISKRVHHLIFGEEHLAGMAWPWLMCWIIFRKIIQAAIPSFKY